MAARGEKEDLMEEAEFIAVSDGEAMHFADACAIPWDAPERARSFNELTHILQYRWFRRALETTGGSGRHLDVACGSGYGSAYLSQSSAVAETVGVDLDEGRLHLCRRTYPSVRFLSGNCERLLDLFAPDSFAFVTSGQTIEHLMDPVAFIDGVRQILRPDGVFLLMSPTHNEGLRALEFRNPFHLVEYSPDTLAPLLEFFFADVRMEHALPAREVFDDLTRYGGGARLPAADAVYCGQPRKALDPASVADFRNAFLLDIYARVLGDIQTRLIAERRGRHYLKDSYHLIDFVSGVFPSELEKTWCMPEASFVLRPSAPGRRIQLRLLMPATAEFPMSSLLQWPGGEARLDVADRRVRTVEIGPLTEPAPLRVTTTPPFVAGEHGLRDIRTLGCCLVGIAEI
jgi:SAM-dependent methyltransferase